MISNENNNNKTVLIALSIIDAFHDNPSHRKTVKNSNSAITQLMPKIILNRVCDKGDDAI